MFFDERIENILFLLIKKIKNQINTIIQDSTIIKKGKFIKLRIVLIKIPLLLN